MMVEENAPDMNLVIARNLKNLRKELNLSLGEAAERTGVSKSMLGQIERAESSPTISTLWKIATGLQISFTALMERAEQEVQIVRKAEMRPVVSDHGHFRLYPVIQAHRNRTFEIVDLELDPGAMSQSQPHADGTEEFVLVYEGALAVEVGGQRYTVEAGCVIHYRADQEHVYRNPTAAVTRAAMVINYPHSAARPEGR